MNKRDTDKRFDCLDDPMREWRDNPYGEMRPDMTRLQSRLVIAGDTLFATAQPLPNAWRRFWTWALLGWRWERIA